MTSARHQHNISLTEPQEKILEKARTMFPKISLAGMVMATAKSLILTENVVEEKKIPTEETVTITPVIIEEE